MRSRALARSRPGELLHLAHAVAQRVAVAEEPARGGLPLPVALDERLQRADELAAVVALVRLDGSQQRLAEQAQRVGVLQGEQQREGAEVAVGGDRPRFPSPLCAGRPRARAPPARSAPHGTSPAPARRGPPGRRRAGRSAATRSCSRRASANSSSSGAAGQQRARRCRPDARRARRGDSLRSADSSSDSRRSASPSAPMTSAPTSLAEPERLQAPLQVVAAEVATGQRGQHVAGQAPRRRVHDAQAQQLEGHRRHALLEQEAVGIRVTSGVLHAGEPRLRRPFGGARARRAHAQHERVAPRAPGRWGRGPLRRPSRRAHGSHPRSPRAARRAWGGGTRGAPAGRRGRRGRGSSRPATPRARPRSPAALAR